MSIQFIRSNAIMREYPSAEFTLAWAGNAPAVMDKETKMIVFIPSPNYYDYIEVTPDD